MEDHGSINNLTCHAVLHACIALCPVGIKLPGSGTHRIEQFCRDILLSVRCEKSPKKKKVQLLPEQELVPEVELLKFYEGALSSVEFAEVVCDHLSRHLLHLGQTQKIESYIHKICWQVYSECQKFSIAYPKWLTTDSTYSLWLVFCAILSSFSESLDIDSVKSVLIRVFKLSSYIWSEVNDLIPSQTVTFPVFLETLVQCFTSLNLHSSVVTEVIEDLKDEVVYGVIKKGYLKKKGHKAPTIKRRWFVLTTNSLIYYKSRDRMIEKGRLVINPTTHLEIMSDKSNRKHTLFVTCGKSGKGYELYADDDKTRNEWKVDIEKAIQLENAIKQNNKEDFDQSISHFLTLRYGTSNPNLVRADSLLRRLTVSHGPDLQTKLRSINASGSLPSSVRFSAYNKSNECRTYTVGTGSNFRDSATVMSEEETNTCSYESMDNNNIGKDDLELHSSDSEDEGYTLMYRGLKYGQQDKDVDDESDCDGQNEVENIEDKGEKSDLVYETVQNSPRFALRSYSQDNLDNVNGLKEEAKEKNSPKKTAFSVKIPNTHTSLDGMQELSSPTHKQLVESPTRTGPVAPPRPHETLRSASSMAINSVSSPPHMKRHMASENPYSSSPPKTHAHVKPTKSNPVPPPRPMETMTSNNTFILPGHNAVLNKQDSAGLEDEGINPKSPRLPHIPLRSPVSLKSESSVAQIRTPPYSQEEHKTTEAELYYVLPNDPSLR